MNCEFCKKTFANNSSLNVHQTSAKYCLKIQGKMKEENKTTNFECSFCKKMFKLKHHLTQHILSCKNKNKDTEIKKNSKEQIKELKEQLIRANIIMEKQEQQLEKQENNYKQQISELQKIIERMGTKAIEKPTTTNNNTTNNNTKINLVPFDLTNEYVSNIITSKFNDVHVLEGVHGLAKFVKDKIITLEDGTLVYRCFDTSRQIFKYQDKNGNIVKDPKALKLIEMIQPALKEQTNTLYDFFNTEIDNYKKEEDEKRNEFLTTKDKMLFLKENTIKIQDEIADMHMNSRFCNELSALTS
jgi:hypothetical protein